MKDFLTRLITRTLGATPGVEPLIPSIFSNAPDTGNDLVDPFQDEWQESSHEGLTATPHPLSVGRPSREENFSPPGRENSDRLDGLAKSPREKPDPRPDLTGVAQDPLQLEAKKMSSDEYLVSRKPEYEMNRAKASPLPAPGAQGRISGHYPTSMEADSRKRFSSILDVGPHRDGRSLADTPQTTTGETDDISRSNIEGQQREVQHFPQGAPEQTTPEDLLVPSITTDPNAYAFTPSQAIRSEFPPNQVLAPPPTRVTIGRIEVRAVMRPEPRFSAAEPVPKKSGPALSLEDYLKQRNGNHR